MRGVSRLVPGDMGTMLCNLLGNPAHYDAGPSVKELGVRYMDWQTTVTDTVWSQAKWGNLPSLD